MTAVELGQHLLNANGSGPGLLLVVVALLWQISGSAKRGFGAVSRIGRRVGELEQARRTDLLRLRVLEQLLRDEGLSVPRFDAAAADDDDEPGDPPTGLIPGRVNSVPAVPPLPASLRRSA